MKFQRILITALLTLLLSNALVAQVPDSNPTDFSKNVIHGSLGTAIAIYSGQLSYDRLLKQSENGFFKSYYLTFRGGGNVGIDFSGNDGGTGSLLSASVTALTGTGKNHFEVGLGLGYFIDTKRTEETTDESTLYPSISIGYRKQIAKGFMFRTGIGVAEWAYVGFGYSF